MEKHGEVGADSSESRHGSRSTRGGIRRNARLGSAMKAAGLTFSELAARSGCHLKTVQRWYYEGRVPRQARAQRIAAALDTSVGWLWPTAAIPQGDEPGDHVRLYPRADGEPNLIIHGMLTSAQHTLDVCSGSSWFLERAATSALRYAKDVQLRVLVPPAIKWNGGSPPQQFGLHLRTHVGVGQLSLLRSDDAMLLIHGIGMDTAAAPVLFLDRRCGGGAFDQYASGFQMMWAQASDHEYQQVSLWQGGDS